MNGIYRSVWSASLESWVAVTDVVSGTGESASSGKYSVSLMSNNKLNVLASAFFFSVSTQVFSTPINTSYGQQKYVGVDFNSGTYTGGVLGGDLAVNSGATFANDGNLENRKEFVNNGVYDNLSNGFLNNNSELNPAWDASTSSGLRFNYYGILTNNNKLNNYGKITSNAKIINSAGASFFNNNSAVLEVLEDNGRYGVLENHGILQNDGEIKNTNWVDNFNYFENRVSGRVENSSTFNNNGDIENYGNFINSTTLYGGGLFQNNGQLSNLGTLNNQVGATLSNAATTGVLNNSGVLANAGQLDNLGTLTNSLTLTNSGQLNNAGTLNNQAGATLTNAATTGVLNNSGVLANAGQLDNLGTLTNSLTLTNSGQLSNVGTLNNQAGATLTNAATTGVLNNTGSLANAGDFDNGGLLSNNQVLTNTGRLHSMAGATLTNHLNATLTNAAAGQFINAGSLSNLGTLDNVGNLDNGGVLSNSKVLTNTGRLHSMAGATLTNHLNATLTNAAAGQFINAGSLSNLGTLDNAGGLDNGGVLSNNNVLNNTGRLHSMGSATLTNHANATLTNAAVGQFINAGSLSNFGILNNAGNFDNGGLLSNSKTLGNTGVLNNLVGATLNNAATGTLTNVVNATVSNQGTVSNVGQWDNYGVLVNGGRFANAGNFENFGSIDVSGVLTSTGVVRNHAGAQLNIGDGGTTGELFGDVRNDGVLRFNRTDNTAYAGQLTGGGSVEKRGTGALLLEGDSHLFNGWTQVVSGTLEMAASGQLGGALNVQSGATLAGTGSVGTSTISSGATLSPGQSVSGQHAVGTLTVNGDLTFQTGSLYQIHLDSQSSDIDRTHIQGTARLNGNVDLLGNASDLRLGHIYTILHASQVQGRFNGLTTRFAYLDVRLGYAPEKVTLEWVRKSTNSNTATGPMALAELAQTANQTGAAQSIESLPNAHPLYNHVLTLPQGAPAAVLSSLSGDAHANVGDSLVYLAARIPGVSLGQLRTNITAGWRPGAPTAQSDGPLPASAWPSSKALPAWAEVLGNWQSQKGDRNAAAFKQHTSGIFAGGDEALGSGWRVGGAIGYTDSRSQVRERDSKFDVKSYSAAVYAGKSTSFGRGRLNLLGGLAYTWHDIATERHVSSLQQTLTADYGASTTQVFAEMGYALGREEATVWEPFANLTVSQQRTRSFIERGGFAALHGAASTDTLVRSTLGGRVQSRFHWGSVEGRVRATLGWRHAFGDVQQKKTMAFEGAQNFSIAGEALAHNTVLAGLEAELAMGKHAALVVGMQGEYGRGSRDITVNAKMRWSF